MGLGWMGFGLFAVGDRVIAWLRSDNDEPEDMTQGVQRRACSTGRAGFLISGPCRPVEHKEGTAAEPGTPVICTALADDESNALA